MSTFSGKSGKILIGAKPLADITRWTLATTAANPSYASSSSGGYRRRVPGVRDGAGRIEFLLDPADPLTGDFDEGDAVTLLLYLDAERCYSVPALIDALELEVDISTGDVVGGVARFSTNGAWTKPTYAS